MSADKVNHFQRPSMRSIVCPKCGHRFPPDEVKADQLIEQPSRGPAASNVSSRLQLSRCPSAVGSRVNRASSPTTGRTARRSRRGKCESERLMRHACCDSEGGYDP
jgi:hypothetical protein